MTTSNSANEIRIAISGGGTGGGVYPALAACAALRSLYPGTEILWLGSTKGPERELVTREGLSFRAVASGQIAGVGLRMLIAPLLIGWGLLQSLVLLSRFKAAALLITGGWVTIPPALACWLLRVPIMIYSPDVEPGGTIRLLSRFATRVAISSPASARFYRPDQVIETGFPVRSDLLRSAGFDTLGQPVTGGVKKQEARQHFGLNDTAPVLLIFGGSSGARSINQAAAGQLEAILAGWQVIHISGKLDSAWLRQVAAKLHPTVAARYHSFEYLHSQEMALALAAADLTLSRAGAGPLGEFPLFRLPAILVPYPYAWRYQKTNAETLVSHGAAIRLDDERLGEELLPLLDRLRNDARERERMAAASALLRRPDAAARLASALAELAHRT